MCGPRYHRDEMRPISDDEAPEAPKHNVTLRIPAALHQRLLEQAQVADISLDEAASLAIERGLLARESRTTPLRLGTSWDIPRPPGIDALTPSYAWTEDLVPSLPLRFRKYVSELLFDDERVLMFVHRPAFTNGAMMPWNRRRTNEGLLLITDRMVLMIQDAIPPGPMFIDWGYDARLAPVERIATCAFEADNRVVQLRIGLRASNGNEELQFLFALEDGAAVAEANRLLAQFARRDELLPRRMYADPIPAWEPPDERAARTRIAGRGVDEVEEAEIHVAEAEFEGAKISVTDGMILIERNKEVVQFSTDAVTSVRIWRAMTGCSLELRVPTTGSVKRYSTTFQYPKSSPFLRVASRTRHVMARRP
jgi:hypothetical protein